MEKLSESIYAMFRNLSKHTQSYRESNSGATAIEYGLMASMIGILAIAGMSKLGTNLNDNFTTVSQAVDGPMDSAPANRVGPS